MFNIVFFVTILSLIIQGMTVNRMARWLNLDEPVREPAFAEVNLPEEVSATMVEYELTREALTSGDTLKEIQLPKGTLAVMAKRKGRYIVPKGDTPLFPGDILLLVKSPLRK